MQNLFNDITGQEQVVSYLTHALESDSVTHAYLLTGAQDSSKESIALRFAASLIALEDETQAEIVLRLAHPDVHIVSPQGTKGYLKEQVSALIYDIALAPVRCATKVYIVNGAEKFNKESANAFLKTLEEPPSGVCIILLASREDAVLETLRSRCQILHCKSRGIQYTSDAFLFDIMYDAATGANNKTLLDAAKQIKNFSSQGLDDLQTRQKQAEEESADFLSTTAKKALTDQHKRECTAQVNAALVACIEQTRAWLRDCLLINQGAADLIAFPQVQNQTMEVATRNTSAALLNALHAAQEALQQISYNVTPQLALEAYLFKIREALCPR